MLILLLLFLVPTLHNLSFAAKLYGFGGDRGDQTIPFSTEAFGVSLDVPIIYSDETQNELFISSNGIVSFGKHIENNESIDEDHHNAIAVFYAAVTDGSVYYRATSSDTNLLNDLTTRIQKNFPQENSADFTALHAIVITWDQMKSVDSGQRNNQFQLLLATDGISSYAIFLYGRIEWTKTGDHHAKAGFYYTNGRQHHIVHSGTENLKELVYLSNNQREGSQIFRISSQIPEDPHGNMETEDYNYSYYSDPDYDDDTQQRPSSAECPPDPYRYRCPPECQILSDDRGCSLCVCTQPPNTASEMETNRLGDSGTGRQTSDDHTQHAVQSRYQHSDSSNQNSNPEQEAQQTSNGVEPHGQGEERGMDHHEETGSSEMPLSCTAASRSIEACNVNAKCIDYNPGFCCKCSEEFFGNGHECLKIGDAQRVSGTMEGTINGEALGQVEFHTYVITSDGRAYTAFSHIEPSIGRSLLLLDQLGSTMGWLFAKVASENSYNGFDLTGGVFNRTINLHVGEQSTVTIRQHFSGRDSYQYFKAKIYITGTLPKLSEGTEVSYSDRDEEYRREGPGFVRSYSSYEVTTNNRADENPIKIAVDQQIQYNECSFKSFDKNALTVVHMTRPHVVYDSEEKIVRYASENSVSSERKSIDYEEVQERNVDHHTAQKQQAEANSQQVNPDSQGACVNERHLCTTANMFCVPVEHSYRCECNRGYQPKIDTSVNLGWICIDVDECERRDHSCDRNAECHNTEGSYTCVCKEDFTGDGKTCRSTSEQVSDAESVSSPKGGCTSHQDCHQWGECVFEHGDKPNYCKCRGWYVGDGINHCGPPGESPALNQRQSEQSCGGYTCDSNAECNYSADRQQMCMCKSGFHGNGLKCEPDQRMTPSGESAADKMCRAHSECGPNANCVYGTDIGYYRCVCVPPYTGDGVSCILDGTIGSVKQCKEASDCHQNAHCIMQEQSSQYVCECLPGYKGDGVQECQSADQCHPTDQRTCDQNAECVYGNSEGAYVCKCKQGYTGSGHQCDSLVDIRSCNNYPQMCHTNAQCVFNPEKSAYICACHTGWVGDGYTSCLKEDSQQCEYCSTYASCTKQADGTWSCRCNSGYQGNGYVCTPLVSCLDDRSICDKNAECVPSESGLYVCNCRYGYHGNGRTCSSRSDSREDSLLIGRGMTIIQKSTDVDTPGKQLIITPHQIAVGIDFDCIGGKIVWSDIVGHTIRIAYLNGSTEREIFADILTSPEGIAVDSSSRNLYYVDSVKDIVGVATLDGKYQKTLITEGLHNPRALAIDLRNKQLYYSDWHRENPMIGRINLDGSNNEQFITTDINLPNGLVVLDQRQELCWVDAGIQRLACIGLDKRNRRVIFAPLEYPFGLTILNEERFYWTDWKDNKVHSVSLNGDGYMSFSPTLGGTGRLYGIVAVPRNCRRASTPCEVNNGGCKYICLPQKDAVKCVCPENVKGLEDC